MNALVKVLVVDDEPQIRRALSLNLGARGYEVFEAESGESAMLVAANEHPDVVLLDLGLGGHGRHHGDRRAPRVEPRADHRADRPRRRAFEGARARRRRRRLRHQAVRDGRAARPDCVRRCAGRTPATEDVAEVRTEHFRLDLAAHRAFVGADAGPRSG